MFCAQEYPFFQKGKSVGLDEISTEVWKLDEFQEI